MAQRPEDLYLPAAAVQRIIKEVLPQGVIVSKEVKMAIGKAASVFVLYTTSCANNNALKAKRKTIHTNDVMAALDDMEFDSMAEPLKAALQAYRITQSNKNKSKKKTIPKPTDDPNTENNEEHTEEQTEQTGNDEMEGTDDEMEIAEPAANEDSDDDDDDD